MVAGRRVKTVDVHGHVFIPEAFALTGGTPTPTEAQAGAPGFLRGSLRQQLPRIPAVVHAGPAQEAPHGVFEATLLRFDSFHFRRAPALDRQCRCEPGGDRDRLPLHLEHHAGGSHHERAGPQQRRAAGDLRRDRSQATGNHFVAPALAKPAASPDSFRSPDSAAGRRSAASAAWDTSA